MNTKPFTPGSTHTVAAHVYIDEAPGFVDGKFQAKPRLSVFPGDNCAALIPGLVYVGPLKTLFTIPEDFDPIGEQEAALRTERARIVSEYEGKLDAIDTKLANLLALPAPATQAEEVPA